MGITIVLSFSSLFSCCSLTIQHLYFVNLWNGIHFSTNSLGVSSDIFLEEKLCFCTFCVYIITIPPFNLHTIQYFSLYVDDFKFRYGLSVKFYSGTSNPRYQRIRLDGACDGCPIKVLQKFHFIMSFRSTFNGLFNCINLRLE